MPRFYPTSGASFRGFTDGSVIFVEDESGAEDNANLFYDNARNSLVVGHTDPVFNIGGLGDFTARLSSHQSDGSTTELAFAFDRAGTDAIAPSMSFFKSRGTKASRLIVASGDFLGSFAAYGWDGTNWQQAAQVIFDCHGTIGSNDIPGRIKFATSTQTTGTSVNRCQFGGPDVVISGSSFPQYVGVHSAETMGQDLSLFRHHATSTVGVWSGMFRSRGTETSPAAVSGGDHVGAVRAAAYDGTDYEVIADVRMDVGPSNIRTGDLLLRTRAAADSGPISRLIVHNTGLIDISGDGSGTPGTYVLVSGVGDLGIVNEFEVQGNSRFEDTIGFKTAPEASSGIVADFADSAITSVIRAAFDYTGSASPLTGYNVLNFTLNDQSTGSTHPGANCISATSLMDRAAPSGTHAMIGVKVVYGQETSRTVSSGTYSWKGIETTAQDVIAARVTGGTFTFIDCDLGNAPTDYSGGTMTHLSLRAQGKAEFQDTTYISTNSKYFGIGVTAPVTAIDSNEVFGLVSNLGDGFSATLTIDPGYTGSGFTRTVTRHNYIDVQDCSVAGTAAVTDACVFRFDAAAGTHRAVDAGTTKASPGTVNAWVLINVNGTIHFIPSYTSKTS